MAFQFIFFVWSHVARAHTQHTRTHTFEINSKEAIVCEYVANSMRVDSNNNIVIDDTK